MASISQNMCRICENNSNKLIDVSTQQFESLIDKYLSCANVNFDITDNLPKYFCETCIDLLNISHNFKEQCEKTYNKLMWQTINLPSVNGIKQENIIIVENVVEEETDDFYNKIFDFDESPPNIKNEKTNKKIGDSNVFNKDRLKTKFTTNELNKMVKTVEKLLQPKNSKNIQLKRKRKRYPKKPPTKTYECYMCKDHSYKAKQPCISHMEIKHKFGINENDEKIIHKCDICENVYSCRPHLIRHYKTIHLRSESDKLKNQTPCEICGKLFSCAANQRRHIRDVHYQEKPHECKMCGNRYSQLTVLQTHIKTHSQIKCNQCDKAFITKIDIENHLHVHFPKEEIPTQLELLYKQQSLNGTNKICEICGKSMTDRQLFYHKAKHGIKMHECKVCSKKFLHKNGLTEHNLIHTGERPHQCDRCPKSFRQWAHLFEHIKTHTGDRPHKCRFCEKSFSMAGNLREHERIHTGERPYSCNLCSQRFANSKALKRHAKSVHPENEAAAVTTKSYGEILNILQH